VTAEPTAAETIREYPPHLNGFSPDEAVHEWLRRLADALDKMKENENVKHPSSVFRLLNKVRDLYASNVTQSDLKTSDPRGFHGLLTIYLEGRR